MPQPLRLRQYSKYQVRCILTDPAIDPDCPPSGFEPMSIETFNSQVLPIFETRKDELGRITVAAYKRMKLLPLKLVRIIFDDAGLTTIQ